LFENNREIFKIESYKKIEILKQLFLQKITRKLKYAIIWKSDGRISFYEICPYNSRKDDPIREFANGIILKLW